MYVAYYRVSTDKQGRSGLGLEAQRQNVIQFLSTQADRTPEAVFTEIESGTRADRPQLQEALRYCKNRGAKLVIAKLDRLARNVHFISGLIESGVDFVACDMPEANKFMVHIMAAVAEHERDMISQRVKDAYKVHTKGTWGKVTEEALVERSIGKEEFAKNIKAMLAERGAEIYSLKQQIYLLNKWGVKTRTGKQWSVVNLSKVLNNG
jgi:DNA invertase Pin-like site-specific DNA recombinase